jgi:hypothetical protein
LTETELDILASKIAERITAPPRWMKLSQAVKYSNIGKERLISLAKLKAVVGYQDHDLKSKPWIFDRESIDQYRARQFASGPGQDAEEFAIDFMQKIGL